MKPVIEDLMYQAGLTAQGCWDEMDAYDREAIEKFAELIVKECIREMTLWERIDLAIRGIKERFGVAV